MPRRWGLSLAILTAVFLAGVILAQLTPAPAQVTPGRPQVVNVQHISAVTHVAGLIQAAQSGVWSFVNLQHITSVVHIAAAGAPWGFAMALATRCVNTAATAFEACGGAGGGGDSVNVFHQSTIRHISSVTHVGGTISLVNQAGTYASFTGTTLDVTCTGCAAASVVAVSHISAAVHIGGTIGGAQFHIQGLGTPGQSHGGVLSIQGIGGGNPVAVIATLGLAVNQQGVWTVQAAHQGGQWNVAHVTSVTHVQGTVTANTGAGQMTCHSTAAFAMSASGIVIHASGSNRIYICGLLLVSTTAQSVAVVEGTAANCGTGTAGIIGSTVASGGPALAANGGWATVAPFPWISSQTAGNNVCLLISGSGLVSGTISYRGNP